MNSENVSQPRKRILIVDDEPAMAQAIARILQPRFAVESAQSGDSAARVLREKPFDVMITDLVLPDIGGLQLLRMAREHDPDLPVIVMTGNPSTDTAVKALEYGAMRYLIKPVDSPELERTVDDACRRYELATLNRKARLVSGSAATDPDERVALDQSFSRALESVYLAYQPVVRWSRRAVHGFEALARSRFESLSTPHLLFGTAEILGRKAELNRALRVRIAQDLRELPLEGNVFVNIEAGELEDEALFSSSHPLAEFAHRVILEITEREAIDRIEHARARVFALRRLGYRIAIDDLGAGYSALTSFAKLEPEVVKIDMSLIRDVHREPLKRKLIGLLVGLCGQMGTTIIAEGVETNDELRSLVGMGCDLFQGYYFARPGYPLPAVSWA